MQICAHIECDIYNVEQNRKFYSLFIVKQFKIKYCLLSPHSPLSVSYGEQQVNQPSVLVEEHKVDLVEQKN